MFLKNRNISSKIKRSKVTDYAALSVKILFYILKLNVNIFKSLPNDLKHIVYSTIVYLKHKENNHKCA